MPDYKPYLTIKDHSVSGEDFQLLMDEELQLLKTSPQPEPEKLPSYYESEDYISHTDGKRSFFEKIYHIVKHKAIYEKMQMIDEIKPGKGRLLDIGAGTGDFLVEAKKHGWKTKGIEPVEKAKAIAVEKGVAFEDTLETVPDNYYDVITMWHVLEHVPDLDNEISQLKRIVKPNGIIVIAVPNFKSYDAKHYGVHWAAYDVPRHLWHFSQTAIKKLFEARGMKLDQVLPMKFDSYYVSLLSEKYKTGKMNFIKGFLSGWKSNRRAKQNSEYSSLIYIIKPAEN